MSKQRITNAIKREERAKRRGAQAVLRRERDLRKVKVSAAKAKSHIKFGLGGDGVVLGQGRMSMDEFSQRARMAADEIQEINELLAAVGLRTTANSGDRATAIPVSRADEPNSQPAKPRRIVQFKIPPPVEFRQKMMRELKLFYEPSDFSWYGGVDPKAVEVAIRGARHWELVRYFCGWSGAP